MKTFLKPVLALALTGVFAAPAFAQATDSETTSGSTEIIQPIALTKTTDLAFGTIVRPSSGSGTVTIDATTGALSVGGGAVSIGSGQTRAAYTVAGEDGRTFSISTPATFAMNRTGGGSLTVTLSSSAASGTLTGGAAAFGVGGSFTVTDATASGNYTGTFSTTVAYN